jgi:hypothetical protein
MELAADGFIAGRDRIARLRRELGIRCRQPPRMYLSRQTRCGKPWTLPSPPPTGRPLAQLQEVGIVESLTDQKRNRVFIAREVLQLLNRPTQPDWLLSH